MDKQVIETLIELTNKEIEYYNDQIRRFHINASVYEYDIELCKEKRLHLNSCLSGLNQLRDFKLPTDDEISKGMSPAFFLGWDQYLRGQRDMRDYIKRKLS